VDHEQSLVQQADRYRGDGDSKVNCAVRRGKFGGGERAKDVLTGRIENLIREGA
jgi:hypothetical protein